VLSVYTIYGWVKIASARENQSHQLVQNITCSAYKLNRPGKSSGERHVPLMGVVTLSREQRAY
jgi:hypothetical protein